MARLYRPVVPLEVKCRVALGQLGETAIDKIIADNQPRRDAGYMVGVVGLPGRGLGRLLAHLLERLAESKECKIEDLRLDHDPPLAARKQKRKGLGRKVYFTPDANDPAHLFYRPHGPEYAGSHLIKTNVRGDHGQHPDRVLIKKARRAERGPKPKRRTKPWPKGRKIRSRSSWPTKEKS